MNVVNQNGLVFNNKKCTRQRKIFGAIFFLDEYTLLQKI